MSISNANSHNLTNNQFILPVTTQMGITLIIMKLTLLKSSINIRVFSKLKSSIRNSLANHDSSSLFWTASLHSTAFFRKFH